MTLVPCAGCHRHVRKDDANCPFCARALPSQAAAEAAPLVATQGASRAQLLAIGLLAATSATACAAVAPAPLYGGPPPAQTTQTAPAYGMPPPALPPKATSNGCAGGTSSTTSTPK